MSEELRTLLAKDDTSGIVPVATTNPKRLDIMPPTPFLDHCTIHWNVKGKTVNFSQYSSAVPWRGNVVSDNLEPTQPISVETKNWTSANKPMHVATSFVDMSAEFAEDMDEDSAQWYERQMSYAIRTRINSRVAIQAHFDLTAANRKAVIGAKGSTTAANLADAVYKGLPDINWDSAWYVSAGVWSDMVRLGAVANLDMLSRAKGLMGTYAGYPVWHFALIEDADLGGLDGFFGCPRTSVQVAFGTEQPIRKVYRPANDTWRWSKPQWYSWDVRTVASSPFAGVDLVALVRA